MQNAAPFPVIVYQPNPAFFQVGQSVSVSPVPGSSASAYVISSGSLPAGLSLNGSTGSITGTASMLTGTALTAVIACTMPDSSIFNVSVTITITNIPATAINSNQASATDLSSKMNYYETNFISQTNAMILNNSMLGKFEVVVDVPFQASLPMLRTYYTSLNYDFWLVYWRSNNANADYYSPLGDFSSGAGFPYTAEVYPYNMPRVGYPIESSRPNKVRISWTATPYNNRGLGWTPWAPWP